MEGEIPVKFRSEERILIFSAIHRIDGLHTTVKADYQIVKVKTDTKPIRHRQLLIESVETEGSFFLTFLFMDVPNITGIHKKGTIQHPEQMGTVFDVHIQLDVTGMIDIIHSSIRSPVTSRTQ